MHNFCNICGQQLKEGEKLLAYYHEPKDWWVYVHLVPSPDKYFTDSTGLIHIPNVHEVCAQARYTSPKLIQ